MLENQDFDMQIWRAKTLMDAHQNGSLFWLAQTQGTDFYTCWRGARDGQPWAIGLDQSGKSWGPTQDGSRIGGLEPFLYPPKYTCVQAGQTLINAGITEAWTQCSLLKHSDYNPVYEFQFATHPVVFVDATTNQIVT